MANLSDIITPTNLVTFTGTDTLTNKTLTAPVLTNATGSLSSPVLTTPNLGTPSALVLTNATGTLTSPTFVTPALGTPASGVMTSVTGLPLTTGVTGTLPVANGGIGATTLTANNVVLGNGTSAVQVVAPSTSGNVLTSDGTTWASTAPSAAGFTLAPMVSIGGTASATFTGIPSTATVIIINFKQCYQGGQIEVQIGDSGGIETSGYESSSARIKNTSGDNTQATSTTYFIIRGGLAASDEYNGTMTLTCLDRSTNHWVSSHTLSSNGTPNFVFGGGQKALSGTLTQVKIGNGTYNSNARVSIAYL